MQALIAENPVLVAPSAPEHPPRFRVIDWLQIGVAVIAVAACCRGEGHPFRWMCAALVIPVGRVVCVTAYRKRVQQWLRGAAAVFQFLQHCDIVGHHVSSGYPLRCAVRR